METKQHAIKAILIGMLLSGSLFAMDVSTYFATDLQSMRISIEGSKKVLRLLKSGAPIQEQYAVDNELQSKLSALFASVDSSPSKLAGYYMKHRKEVDGYYKNNPTLQKEYAILKAELEKTNQAIEEIRKAHQ